MKLGESKATQILNTYLNFCRTLQRDGEITVKNFNRIRIINGCIGGRQESVKAVWEDIFDEIYKLLEQPVIKSRLEQEKREVELLREKRKNDKQKHLSEEKSETLKKVSEKNVGSSSKKKKI